MKIDGRAMALFNIKKEVYLVAILKTCCLLVLAIFYLQLRRLSILFTR